MHQHSPEELEKINKEIEDQLNYELDNPKDKKSKKAYQTIQFWMTFVIFLFIFYGFIKIFL